MTDTTEITPVVRYGIHEAPADSLLGRTYMHLNTLVDHMPKSPAANPAEERMVLIETRNILNDVVGSLQAQLSLAESNERIRTDLVERLQRERQEAFDFRIKVRQTAIDVAESQGWCKAGLNDTLRELGLDPVEQSYEVEVEVSQRITIAVDAVDEDAAREEVENMDSHEILSNADDYDWSYDVRDVTEA